MAKYDYTRLKTFCDLKNITLVGRDYSKERINAHTKIEFNCVELDCVSTHIKNMESFMPIAKMIMSAFLPLIFLSNLFSKSSVESPETPRL